MNDRETLRDRSIGFRAAPDARCSRCGTAQRDLHVAGRVPLAAVVLPFGTIEQIDLAGEVFQINFGCFQHPRDHAPESD